jgi:hypothetical protein
MACDSFTPIFPTIYCCRSKKKSKQEEYMTKQPQAAHTNQDGGFGGDNGR